MAKAGDGAAPAAATTEAVVDEKVKSKLAELQKNAEKYLFERIEADVEIPAKKKRGRPSRKKKPEDADAKASGKGARTRMSEEHEDKILLSVEEVTARKTHYENT